MQSLPEIDGVAAGTVHLPAVGPWVTVLAFLIDRFPGLDAAIWRNRIEAGRVVDAAGQALAVDSAFCPGQAIHYWREVADEPPLPCPFEPARDIIHHDDQLLVIDKPHFMPVIPAGRWLRGSLLVQARLATGIGTLVPLHRIDRATAGIVAFSVEPATRGRYQQLFARREVRKRYEALAPPHPGIGRPLTRRSRLEAGQPFFRMREAEGPANSESRIEVLENLGTGIARYGLEPVTGRKHQLRVHMAALGIPILNDALYPELREPVVDDAEHPLKLLARAIEFVDPLTGVTRSFQSRRQL